MYCYIFLYHLVGGFKPSETYESIGMMIFPNIWENISVMFQSPPTSHPKKSSYQPIDVLLYIPIYHPISSQKIIPKNHPKKSSYNHPIIILSSSYISSQFSSRSMFELLRLGGGLTMFAPLRQHVGLPLHDL